MINPDMIPDDVVEAAAEAIERADVGMVPSYQDAARAAIAAALAAWPGVDYRPGAKVTKTWRDPGKIILPLPKESSDD